MNTTIGRLVRLSTLAALPLLAGGLAITPTATAASGDVIAADSSIVAASGPHVSANVPRGLVVSGHDRQQVSALAKGERIRRVTPRTYGPVTVGGLTPGVVYVVRVGQNVVGSVRVLERPLPASALTVRASDTPTAVSLTWRHTPTTRTGGPGLRYEIVATPRSGEPVRTTVTGRRSAMLTGLDPSAIYTFSVAPTNSAGSGRATKATMSRALRELVLPGSPEAPARPAATDAASATASAVAPAKAPEAAPAPAPGPAPAPRPATKTIYVCPEGFTDAGDACTKTAPYTYATAAYTYHQEQIGTTPTYTGTCDAVRTVWKDGSWQVEHYGYSCIQGGDPIYGQVKDVTPIGWEDSGTQWRKKDAPPAGYTDDGTQYVQTAAKVAMQVLV